LPATPSARSTSSSRARASRSRSATPSRGRLILADALALADEEKPELLVDSGTLTGAARTALGPDLPPFYTNDETLAADVARLARQENDPLWRMPLWPALRFLAGFESRHYHQRAVSAFAGSIVCALFLQRFVEAARAGCMSNLRLDAVGKARPPRGRRVPGRRARSTSC
jgi:leucyl aminopeptidase